jgi:ABC-type uncharacterized transport system auxiliary subunit
MRKFYVLVLLLGLGACSGQPPVPEDHYYRLTAPQATALATPLVSGPIFVERFIADGIYHERALVYSKDGSATDLLQHHYHFWSVTPSVLIRDQLIDFLRAAGAASAVVSSPDVVSDLSIFGTVRRFDRELHGGSATVAVTLDIRVEVKGGDAPLLVRTYEQRVDVSGDSVDDSISAYAQALTEIYAKLVTDIADSLNALHPPRAVARR